MKTKVYNQANWDISGDNIYGGVPMLDPSRLT